MTRYQPARHYLPAALVALALAVFAAWCGFNWKPAFIACGLLALSAALMLFLATRPPIVIRERSFSIGRRSFLWSDVERLEAACFGSPLLVKMTLQEGAALRIVYPGEPEAARRLLEQMRRLARNARLGGPRFRQTDAPASPAPRYRLLCAEDEAEVERLYQRLKSAGRLDHQTSSEERHE